MRFIQTFQFWQFLDSFVSLLSAFLLGTVIGAERQYRQRVAGLRTNVLVAVGAAAFVDLGARIVGAEGATRVIANVVTGVGFLGAGAIMKEGANIRGLNTAATLWASAAVGAMAGADMVAEACLVTLFILAGNTMLRPVVNFINERPIDTQALEGEFTLRITVKDDAVPSVRNQINNYLSNNKIPVSEIESEEVSDTTTDLVVTLVATSIDTKTLDGALVNLRMQPEVLHASWEMNTNSP
ncbi:MgtC/SapB family protein [Beijerinckia mobilis]|uniref:MgtC/SapB family protein n=1 Tax=Beijerinckia mobilis TaxID=231434 RepID=UPI00055501B0|nr:MgtC/SapB family protein [Beijerinckia mobilis]